MKFNKMLVLLSAFCVVCTTMPVTSIRNTPAITAYSADEKTYEGLIYHEYEDYVTITNYDEKLTGDIVIPSEINGKPVTVIESYAFYNCTNLTSVEIPENVTNIGLGAFIGCMRLTSVTIPKNISVIERDTFKNCESLTSVEIPENVKSIGEDAFMGCESLTKINIPDSLTDIGSNAFLYCSGVTAFEVSENNPVYTSENGVLLSKDKSELICYCCGSPETEYTVPEYVKSIDKYAFSGCKALNTVTLNENITEIKDFTFSRCKNLTAVNIPKSVTCIGEYAFSNCTNLKSFIIPENVVSIGDYAFFNCPSLLSVTIQNPDCEIFDSDSVFPSETIIYGYQNSTAQAYAEKYDRINTFAVIDADNILPEPLPPVSLTAKSHSVKVDTISRSTDKTIGEFSIINSLFYNNGFSATDTVQELKDADRNIYAVCGNNNSVTLVSENNPENSVLIEKNGFQFGGAVIDDGNNLFILWGTGISEDSIESAIEDNFENLVVVKYDLQGNTIKECGIPVSTSYAQYPFVFGNANLAVKDNILGCFFDTERTVSADGVNHQCSEFAAINTETMELIKFKEKQGSHSFGVCMLPTEYGFAAIQMGDKQPRGINLNKYILSENNVSVTNNLLYHASGNSGIKVYLHMGGLAKAKNTYAVAGKSKREYDSVNVDSSFDGYDVFVKITDDSFNENVVGFAGEDRIDKSTGEIADRHVVWLTESDKAEQVKIVTLDDNNYCVLWDKVSDDETNSVHYVILDECGNLLQKESEIKNAKLSSTSVQPVVNGNTLTWAVADAENSTLTFYKVNLSDKSDSETSVIGDVNLDGRISISDSVRILQYVANNKKYPLDSIAMQNADVYNRGDGVTGMDAVSIQKYDAGVLTELPESVID